MVADARRVWIVAEPLHALTYFAPEAQRAFEEAGLRGFWRGYFAGRAAPLGPASAGLVTAVFFGFHPDFVARAVPSIWNLVDPAHAIAARLEGIDRAVRRIFGADGPSTDAVRIADSIRAAAERSPVDGRALFGANLELDWPDAAHLRLWHAVTLLREHRGDSHVHLLLGAGIDACEAHVLRIADDNQPLESIQPYRGWDESDWSEAAGRLRERGWLAENGSTTPAGRSARQEIERSTDRLSGSFVDHIDDLDFVVARLGAIAIRLERDSTIPYPNPIGVPSVSDVTWD